MKYLALLFCCVLLMATVSCKKDYTCCFKDDTGATVGGAGFGCVTIEMSKKEKDDTVEAGELTIDLCGTACDGWTYTCE